MHDVLARLVASRSVSDACAMLFVTPPGELHDLGVTLAASLVAMHGLRPCMLGAAVPAGDVAAAARALRPRAVVVGTTLCMESDALGAYVTELAGTLPPRIDLWVGGEGARRTGGWPARVHPVRRWATSRYSRSVGA